jgi:hypothetical protein
MATSALLITVAAAGLLAPVVAFSQAVAASGEDDAIDGAKPVTVRIKPVLIDTGSTQGATLGVDYNIQAKYSFSVGDKIGQGEDMFTLDDVNATLRSGQIDLRARGTLTSAKEKNPNKLLEFAAKGVYKINKEAYFLRLGAIATYETDQSFDNRQHMFGVTASVTKVSVLRNGDAGTLILNYGSVKPSNDAERERVLGNLDSFRRVNAELSYSIPVNRKQLRSIDFNYRHYQETGASGAIKAAGLDEQHLGLIRANLDQDFFIQYSRGALPFDLRSERAVKIGWSLKLE